MIPSSPLLSGNSAQPYTDGVSSGLPILQKTGEGVAIAIMGATGSGKTTLINLVSGSNLRIGRGLKSCTDIVQMAVPFEIDGRSITLIDTPGFDDTTKSDADVLKMIAAFLQTSYEYGKKLAGIIYMHRISDFRMSGISTRNFKMFRELCGDSTLKNVVIVTNMWGEVNREIGEDREAELVNDDMFFKPALDKRAQLVRHDNTLESARVILQRLIPNRPEALRIQQELVDEHMDISQTAAAEELNRELIEQARRHQAELRQLEEEMKMAIKEKDEETRRELEAECMKLRKELEQIQTDSQRLASEYNEERVRVKEKMQEMADQARRDKEAATQKYERQLQEYQQQLENSTAAFAADKEILEKRVQETAEQTRRDNEVAAAKYQSQMNEYRQKVEHNRRASAAEKVDLEKRIKDIEEKAKRETNTIVGAGDLSMHKYMASRISFSTTEVRPWHRPQLKNSSVVERPPSNFAIGITSLDIDKNANIRLHAYIDTFTQDSIKVHLDAWADTILYSASCTWLEIRNDRDFQCGQFRTTNDHPWNKPQQHTSRRIKFSKSYATKPQVVVWLSQIDMDRGRNWRVKAFATDVSPDGFTIHIDTWANTILYSAAASWVSISPNHANITSGSFHTGEKRSWNPPQLCTQGHTNFDKTLQRAPRVWAALNSMDINCNANMRLKVNTSNITTQGMTWNIDGWANTGVHSAGAAYIAIQDI